MAVGKRQARAKSGTLSSVGCHETNSIVALFREDYKEKLPLEQRAELAFRAAVEEVIIEHARRGLPIYIWREGKWSSFLPKNCERNPRVCKRNESIGR